jgi:valyl-tRNA synthetase
MLQPYPAAAEFPPDEAAERETAWIQAVVLGVRQIRGEMNISPARRIPLLLRDAGTQDREWSVRHRPYLERLAGLESVTLLEAGAVAPQSAIALVGTLALLVPMAGLIDAPAEIERLTKLIGKAQKDLAVVRARLASESFVANAPAAVVAADRERLTELEHTVTGLNAQLERVRGLGAS